MIKENSRDRLCGLPHSSPFSAHTSGSILCKGYLKPLYGDRNRCYQRNWPLIRKSAVFFYFFPDNKTRGQQQTRKKKRTTNVNANNCRGIHTLSLSLSYTLFKWTLRFREYILKERKNTTGCRSSPLLQHEILLFHLYVYLSNRHIFQWIAKFIQVCNITQTVVVNE